MATQRYISSSFWSDDWVDSLNIKEKLIYLYLLTNDNTSICGVYKLTIKRIKDDTGISREDILKILERFADDKKAYYVDEYIILPRWLKHQHLNNEKVRLGTIRALKALPEHIIAFLKDADHFYYDINMFLNKEAMPPTANPQPQTESQSVNNTDDVPIKQEVTERGIAHIQNEDERVSLTHESNTEAYRTHQKARRSAHDSDFDFDFENDSLTSLDISTNLERGRGEEIETKEADKPPSPPKSLTLEKTKRKFIKPSVQEISEYCRSRNNNINAESFFNFYESKNWYVGKNKMSNWKAAIHVWENRQQQHPCAPPYISKQYDYNTTGSCEQMPF